MSTIDPQDDALDPDTGLPQEPAIGQDDANDPVGENLRDGAADGSVLSDPDLPLDETPDGASESNGS